MGSQSPVRRCGSTRVLTTTVKSGSMAKSTLAFGDSGRGAASGFQYTRNASLSPKARNPVRNMSSRAWRSTVPLARPGGGIFLRFAKLEFERE